MTILLINKDNAEVNTKYKQMSESRTLLKDSPEKTDFGLIWWSNTDGISTWRFFHKVKGSAVDDGRVFAEGDGGLEGARRVLPRHHWRPRAARRRLGRVRLHFAELVVHHGAVRRSVVAANTRQGLPGPENCALMRIPSRQLLTLQKL